ncbi:Organic solute transporter alpha-like protein W01D2.5 [Trachymyrmex zeteki]|uniref:Organic solute transporter alpha-like protein W01D2.5 n=1 Tax=Mycetomoellerius zeteki TaxID=64791 RepID=A0A151X6K6_9HYME|nr:PREDICTED: organic solute transporter alpha-like protein 3 [Trachymyrmex zeteki]KYQ56016.1 Organic solute transporter alpha-like protein W01D2.5 [Trachymyrmex zeteki]
MDNSIENFAVHADVSCNPNNVPSAIELVESLDALGTVLLSVGSIILVLTIYFSANACHNILSQKDSELYKTNAIIILSVYPIASVCSLMAIAVPRGQLLSEAVTQIFLMISLYRLYLLLLDVGRRKISETPALMLRVGPCCCWPCLPFPNLQMTDANLSWIGILALQLPIVQSLLYFILLYMEAEDSMLVTQYVTFLQPVMVISILLGIYSLTVTTKTLHTAVPEVKLHYKTLVLQLVLLFSKLQTGIIRALPAAGVFPCNPPLTPAIYANVTCNALMLIEMMVLCYVAWYVYYVDLEKNQETDATDKTSKTSGQVDAMNSNDSNKQLPAIVTA